MTGADIQSPQPDEALCYETSEKIKTRDFEGAAASRTDWIR